MTLLESIDAKIMDVLNYPGKYASYKMGNKTYNQKDYLSFLYQQRKLALENPEPEIAVIEFEGFNVDEFGEIS